MEVNETLLISLNQDLDVLNTTLKSIPVSNEEQSRINSWLFPTKNYRFVTELLDEEDLREVPYQNCLEIIIDRIYATVRLITKYLETASNIKKTKRILTPPQLTLGFSVDYLWKNIEKAFNEMNKKTTITTNTKDVIYVDKECQTDIISSYKCDSCSSAITCMKNVLKCFEEHGDSVINSEREKLRIQIYDITQFGSMLKTTTTIEKTLGLMFDKLHKSKHENLNLKTENENLRSEIDSKLGSITVLEKEVDIFKENYGKDKLRLNRLTEERDELKQIVTKHELKIKTLEEMVKNLNNCVKKFQESIQKVVHERDSLLKGISSLDIQQTTITNFLKIIERKIHKVEIFHEDLVLALKHITNGFDKFNNSLDFIENNCTQLLKKLNLSIQKYQEDSNDVVLKMQNAQKRITENLIRSLKVSHEKQTNGTDSYKVRGNPIEDMTRQIEENKKNIRMLQNENEKFELIISKFSKLGKI